MQLLKPKAGDRKGMSPHPLERLLSVQSPSAASLSYCCGGTEMVQLPSWLSPSCTKRRNRKGFPPFFFPDLQHRGLLVPVLLPSWGEEDACVPPEIIWEASPGTGTSLGQCVGPPPPDLPGYPVLGTCTTVKLIGMISWAPCHLYFPF